MWNIDLKMKGMKINGDYWGESVGDRRRKS
jgi:hypothetical protein